MADLKELSERLEKSTGNLDDWRPDGDVNTFTGGEIDRWTKALFSVVACTHSDETLLRNALKGSVDAALALVERRLPGRGVQINTWVPPSARIFGDKDSTFPREAPTPALAIMRALVAALIAQEKLP